MAPGSRKSISPLKEDFLAVAAPAGLQSIPDRNGMAVNGSCPIFLLKHEATRPRRALTESPLQLVREIQQERLMSGRLLPIGILHKGGHALAIGRKVPDREDMYAAVPRIMPACVPATSQPIPPAPKGATIS